MGARPGTVLGTYLLGNVIDSVPAIAMSNAADTVTTLTGLGFLGVGSQPAQGAEWAYDLQRAVDGGGAGMWWTALFPGIAVILAILGFTLVAEGLSDITITDLKVRDVDNAPLTASMVDGEIRIDCTVPTMEPITEAEGECYNAAPTFANFGFDDDQLEELGWG